MRGHYTSIGEIESHLWVLSGKEITLEVYQYGNGIPGNKNVIKKAHYGYITARDGNSCSKFPRSVFALKFGLCQSLQVADEYIECVSKFKRLLYM